MDVFSTLVLYLNFQSKMADEIWEVYAFESDIHQKSWKPLSVSKMIARGYKNEEESQTGRLTNLDWCSCGNCVLMPTRKECLHCKEMELLEPFITNLSLTCFFSHTDFTAMCLDRSILRTSLTVLKEFKYREQRVDLPNQSGIPNR